MHLQVRYFSLKLVISSFLTYLFCVFHENLKLVIIIASLIVFIIYHFIEGFFIQKKLTDNVKKK